MLITANEFLTLTKLTNHYVIRKWGLLWNIRMVAEANGVSEQTVKDLVKAGHSLADQLQNPLGFGRRRDLNNRHDHIIISKNGIDFSWTFIKYILKFNDPGGFEPRARSMVTVYRYWLQKDNKTHSEKNFLAWLDDYLPKHDRGYENAVMQANDKYKWDVLASHYERYQKSDKNDLRISATPTKDIWELAKQGQSERDPNARFYVLSPQYHNLMRHLPAEHIPEMVAFMLQHAEYQWLPENK